jgi:hypothetical protein
VYIARSGGACLGSCPTYDVYVFSDGRVIFRGNGFTAAIGLRTKRIRPAQFQTLRMALEESHFFSAAGGGECVTDQPEVRIEMSLGEGIQSRAVDSGCRLDRLNLWQAVERIDEIAGVRTWAKQRGSRR